MKRKSCLVYYKLCGGYSALSACWFSHCSLCLFCAVVCVRLLAGKQSVRLFMLRVCLTDCEQLGKYDRHRKVKLHLIVLLKWKRTKFFRFSKSLTNLRKSPQVNINQNTFMHVIIKWKEREKKTEIMNFVKHGREKNRVGKIGVKWFCFKKWQHGRQATTPMKLLFKREMEDEGHQLHRPWQFKLFT